jgi:outer membrane protein OmpA-like peptidoglycan-associated protein
MKAVISTLAFCGLLSAQAQPANPTQNQQVVQLESTPIYRVTVVSRTAKAVNYRHRGGATKIDFRGTALMPNSRGEAKVESKQGYIEIEVEFDNLSPATQFGPEYLTYVMWAISPEGRATNLGEVLLNGTKSKLNVTTELQSFGLIVTAEPYFAVTQPSDVVVMENIIRQDTLGKVEVIDAKYELLKRGTYVFNADQSRLRSMPREPSKIPLYLYEARNAVQIAQWAGADKYAGDTYKKAEALLRQAEDYQARKQTKPLGAVAREAVQTAEDARLITLQRIEAERQENERRAAAERERVAKEAQADEARKRAQADEARRAEELRRAQAEETTRLEQQRRAQADADRLAADKARAAAEAERLAAEKAKAEADAARAALATEAEKARLAAADADRARLRAETDKERLRQQLLQQLNLILETRDTVRGLIVNMSDVLFDTAKYTLRPIAREKLARLAGIILAYPGLRIEVEGHTDSVGGDAYNQRLSEQRADGVLQYLLSNGLPAASLTARGFGKTMPVASNDTAAGRQQNRRVELVVSGEVIGTKLSDIRGTTAPRQ